MEVDELDLKVILRMIFHKAKSHNREQKGSNNR